MMNERVAIIIVSCVMCGRDYEIPVKWEAIRLTCSRECEHARNLAIEKVHREEL